MIKDFTFASDNTSGIHPDILNEMLKANKNNYLSYGDDPYTKEAIEIFKSIFGKDIKVFFALTGTGANVLSILETTKSFNSVICTDISHINTDECGAPESIGGVKLLTIKNSEGKLNPMLLENYIEEAGNEHHTQPKLISITQPTEVGTLYTPEEIKAIADFAHKSNMYLHMDGARIANAVVALNTNIKTITTDAGVDIMSFGGTKNGMMIGEAVIIFNNNLGSDFKYYRKQSLQLLSKMRFISAQFLGYFKNNLWIKNAEHANKMAEKLAGRLKEFYPFIEIVYKVQTNAVFIKSSMEFLEKLRENFFFYIMDKRLPLARLMTSFNTTEEKIDTLISTIKKLTER